MTGVRYKFEMILKLAAYSQATPHLVYPHLVYPHYVYYFDKVPHVVYSAIDTVPHLVYFHFFYIWYITYSKQKELSYIYLHIYTYSNNINNTII